MQEVAALKEAATRKDAEIAQLHESQRVSLAERAAAASMLAAVERQRDELTALQTQLQNAVNAATAQTTAFTAQLAAKDSQISALRTELDAVQSNPGLAYAGLDRNVKVQLEELQKQNEALRGQVAAQLSNAASLEDKVSKLNEEVTSLNRRLAQKEAKIKKWKEKASSELAGTPDTPGGSALMRASSSVSYIGGGGGDGVDDPTLSKKLQQLDMLKLRYTCSACRERFRNMVITKCFHVFCKECIDERIRVRNRKCPDCQTPFGVDDVKSVFL